MKISGIYFLKITLILLTVLKTGLTDKTELIRTASNILDNIDKNINPCENFYNFACGGFIKSHAIPKYKKRISTGYLAHKDMILKMKTMLESDVDIFHSINISVAKHTYKKCLNFPEILKTGLKNILKIIKTLGGMPLIENEKWSENDFDWMKTVHKLRKIGFSPNYFLDVDVKPFIFNTSFNAVQINRPQISELIRKEKYYKIYREQIKNILFHLADKRSDLLMKDISDIITFELYLSGIQIYTNFGGVSLDSLDDLTNGTFSLREYIEKLMPKDIKLSPESLLTVDFNYLEYVTKIINTFPKKVQANYIFWRVLYDSIKNLYITNFDGIMNKFGTQTEPRWEKCLNLIRTKFQPLEIAYLRSFFKEKNIQYVSEMVQNIKLAFEEMFLKVNWMDKRSKIVTVEKLEYITKFIGYNGSIPNLDSFSIQNLQTKSFHEIMLEISKAETDAEFLELNNPDYKNKWIINPTDVNAVYFAALNSIYIPAGILNGIYFNENRPHYMNYGSIGHVIAHEMAHAFGLIGLSFDKTGNFIPLEWNEVTKLEFQKILNCISSQYRNYSIGNYTLKTRATLNEDVADIFGMKNAYDAYKKWEMENGPEPKLPGVKYNSRQMFWISAANTFCDKRTAELTEDSVLYNVHSLAEIRILKSFQNIPDFSDDFNCPVGSKMNPVKKCIPWKK